ELDDISGSGQTEAVHEICSGVPKTHQKHLEVKGAGHYGIFSGRRWREKVYPEVKAFILEHQAAQSSAASKPAAPAVATPAAATGSGSGRARPARAARAAAPASASKPAAQRKAKPGTK
ncbi:MAG: polyhydroxyalkanoate depolymerase, partial [Rhodoferax sp.]|nr:polyhydroxyalkanoate depolymerase [Rhodoferax sp.]